MAGEDLERFVTAQEETYGEALGELRRGRKESHWMWFVFPQIAGLGSSPMARRYAIASGEEARAYLAHPLLGPRLRQCFEAVLGHRGRSAEVTFGPMDAIKLRSSLTLFEAVADAPELFAETIDAFYDGERDEATLGLLSA